METTKESTEAGDERQRDRERNSAYKRKYRERNFEKIKAAKREYRERNLESINIKEREYKEKNKEKIKKQKSEYWEKNKERLTELNVKWRANNRKHLTEYMHQYINKNISARMKMYRSSASKSGRAWELSLEDFTSLVTSEDGCTYCGDPAPEGVLLGIDRMDNGEGYTKENSVTCCWPCNRAKGPISAGEWISLCQRVSAHCSE